MKNSTYWVLAALLCMLALLFKDDTLVHAKTILIVASFLVSYSIIIKNRDSYPLRYLVLLYVWLFLSYIIASNKSLAATWVTNGAVTLLTSLSFFAIAQKKKFVPIAYIINLIAIVMLARFAYSNIYLLSEDFTFGENRLSGEGLNTNTLAYFLFYLTFIVYTLGDIIEGSWSKILKYIFFLIIPLSFFVSILTASRQVLVIQIPLIVALILIRYSYKSSRLTIIVLLVGILALVYLPKVASIYENSYLAERNQKDLKTDTRYKIMENAIAIGNENFITGIGIGNLPDRIVYIAHNSYLELYADNGIFGMLIYVFLTFGFVKKQYWRYKRTKDRNYLSFMTFGIFFITDNFFYVFYTEYWLMSFYVLVVTHAETYYRDKIKYGVPTLVSK